MKTMRKSLGILLVIAMLCTLFVGTVSAADVTVQTIDKAGSGKIAPDGIPTVATDIDYLSDRGEPDATTGENVKFKNDGVYNDAESRFFVNPTKAYKLGSSHAEGRTVNEAPGRTFYWKRIYLGATGTEYTKGIGVHPAAPGSATEWSLIYATKGADFFYAVVGGNGYGICDLTTNANKNSKVIFEVYGSNAKDGEYTLLANSEPLYHYLTAEFNVDISDYNYVKLLVKMSDDSTTSSNCAVAWGNACVYSVGEYTHMTAGTADFTVLPEGVTYLTEGASVGSKFKGEEGFSDVDPAKLIGYSILGKRSETVYNTPLWNHCYNRTANATITLGQNTSGEATTFTYGIGTLAGSTAEGSYIMFDVTGYEHFYSAVGGTNANMLSGANDGKIKVVYEVWGSKKLLTEGEATDSSLIMLATSKPIGGKDTGEFNVDITGYKTLKLVTRYATAEEGGQNANSSTNSAWGSPCVYNLTDYAVTYDGNGGKAATDATTLTDAENVTGCAAATLTVKADANTFVNGDKVFKGWNTKADGTGTAYAADADVALTVADPSVTLYAQWGDATLPTYTVTIKIEGKEDATQTVEHGADAVLPQIPAKDGYDAAWDKDGKNITADTTITAVYTRKVQVATVISGNKKPAGLSSSASNVTNLADLYKQDIKDAAKHELVENPKYVVYSYVQKNGNFPNGRIFGVNTTFFPAKLGSWTDGKYTYAENLKNAPITLGEAGTVCTTGLSLQPAGPKDAKQVELVMDISSLKVTHFYSLVGFTGAANNPTANSSKELLPKQALRYEVYGSTDNTNFELLSYVEIKGSDVGEFNVNISGYKYLKLVTKNINIDNTSSQNNEAAWGNAVLYNADQPADTADSFSLTAVAAAIVAATSVTALVVSKKKFF